MSIKKALKWGAVILVVFLLVCGVVGMWTGKNAPVEIPDDDLFYLLGMTKEKALKTLGRSEISPIDDKDGRVLVYIDDDANLVGDSKGYVNYVGIFKESSKTLCGISIGDKEQDVIKQMKMVGAELELRENVKDSIFPYLNLIYSVRLSDAVTVKFNWMLDIDTKQVTTEGAYIKY